MKRNSLYTLLFVLFFLCGCTKKNYEDALPKVEFVSATQCGNDSAILVGNVIISGADAVQITGFAYASIPNFDITSNQLVLAGSTGQFSGKVLAYPDSTYYFKCFAANDYGYVVSNTFKCTIGSALPDSAPCSINNNILKIASGSYTLTNINYGIPSPPYGNYQVEADDGFGNEIDYYFNALPANGIYNVVSDLSFDTNPYDCQVMIDQTYGVNAGGKVYVAHNKDGTVTISDCSLTFMVSSTPTTTSCKVRS